MPEPSHLETTRAAYDTVAADYATLLADELETKPLDRGLLATFAELAKTTGGLVADIGCGPGRITAYLESLGVTALGLDLSPAMIEVAQATHPNLPFDVSALPSLDLADRCLGGALAWYSIIHTPAEELAEVVSELDRVLMPGGYLLMAFQSGENEVVRREEAYGHSVTLENHLHEPDDVVQHLEKAGLEIRIRVLREPDQSGFETRKQAYLLARKAA